MSLSTEDFYTSLCDGWDDAVGDSLKSTFYSTCIYIQNTASFINNEIDSAEGCINAAKTILDGATMPPMPSV